MSKAPAKKPILGLARKTFSKDKEAAKASTKPTAKKAVPTPAPAPPPADAAVTLDDDDQAEKEFEST